MKPSRVKLLDPKTHHKVPGEQKRIKDLVVRQAPFGAKSAVVFFNSTMCTRIHVVDEDTTSDQSDSSGAPSKTVNTEEKEEGNGLPESCHRGPPTWEVRPPWPSRNEHTTMQSENAWLSLPVLPSRPKAMALITGKLILATEVAASRRRALTC
ncbi:hypothetical protein PG985_002757 [Apiospora marii]|uniref:uncharacterized protein n=1 Tax=Apiospora marii TaxID=335849 RepID=UPI00312F91F8